MAGAANSRPPGPAAHARPLALTHVPWPQRARTLMLRVVLPALQGGGIHAGNIAYLAMATLFPLAILMTAAGSVFGRTDAGRMAIGGLLRAMPPQAAALLAPVIEEVLSARTGHLLWAGALVGLWTVSGFVETIRDIFHRAYAHAPTRPFWVYRLLAAGATLVAMAVLLLGFLSQLVLQLLLDHLRPVLPHPLPLPDWVDLSRFAPPVVIFGALWLLFKLLAPAGFRHSPGWPGALFTTVVWVGAALLMGPILSAFGGMGLTYGALSGVMATMLFFYVVGLALVAGAQLNAALANSTRST
jgi:membrane protein